MCVTIWRHCHIIPNLNNFSNRHTKTYRYLFTEFIAFYIFTSNLSNLTLSATRCIGGILVSLWTIRLGVNGIYTVWFNKINLAPASEKKNQRILELFRLLDEIKRQKKSSICLIIIIASLHRRTKAWMDEKKRMCTLLVQKYTH